MPESGTYGSVRGVPGNRHPYRDRGQQVYRPALTQHVHSRTIDTLERRR
jgi:hypothetical protein